MGKISEICVQSSLLARLTIQIVDWVYVLFFLSKQFQICVSIFLSMANC